MRRNSLHHPGYNPLEFDGIRKQEINYRIHTDAIKDTLIPPTITKAQANAVYASEADLLNVAFLGQTANLDSLDPILILLAQARASC